MYTARARPLQQGRPKGISSPQLVSPNLSLDFHTFFPFPRLLGNACRQARLIPGPGQPPCSLPFLPWEDRSLEEEKEDFRDPITPTPGPGRQH